MSGFDRLPGRARTHPAPSDPQGKRALFSQEPAAPPALGSVVLDCPACGETSVLSPRQALRAALPSLHLPLLKPGAGSWMRCPACRRRGWLHAVVQL